MEGGRDRCGEWVGECQSDGGGMVRKIGVPHQEIVGFGVLCGYGGVYGGGMHRNR